MAAPQGSDHFKAWILRLRASPFAQDDTASKLHKGP